MTSPIDSYLQELYRRYASLSDGEVATYIPELAKADPNWFGISIATTDGHVYQVGDCAQPFTIQSISKPFTYGLALEDHGHAAVLKKVGVEPSGEAFNSISLAPGTGCPLNPMINAGAIATASLIKGASKEERSQRLLQAYSAFAGRNLSINEDVYRSEKETGHRNRAIGHMLRNFDILTEDPEPTLDLYFQQCSIDVTCRDLAVMAATLANEGLNPVTGERAIKQELVDTVTSVMMSCGMYDFAGEWLYWVGVPAKSGVAGGVLAVLPGQLGIAVFSPRLDAHGNSVRGIAVCKELSRQYDLHCLRVPRSGRAAIRATYDVSSVRSKRLRPPPERELLDESGRRARVYELQGDLMFAATEVAVRTIVEVCEHIDAAVVDFKRVSRIDDPSMQLLLSLLRALHSQGKEMLFANVGQHRRLERLISEAASSGGAAVVGDLDRAIERCENKFIAQRQPPLRTSRTVALEDHELCRNLSPADLTSLRERLEHRQFRRGDFIVRGGEPAEEIFLLTQGEVSVSVELANGQARRLATLSPGMAFGEIAVIRRTPRTADVRADGPVECFVLSRRELDHMAETQTGLRMKLLDNLLRNVADRVVSLSAEVAAFSD